MGDYTQMQVMVHDCPEGEAWALSVVLEAWDLAVDWDGPPAERGVVHIGQMYTERSVSGNGSSEIADEIIKAAPGATFIAWTDPAYDWQGVLVRYTPELGRHQAECTEQGDAIFTEHEVYTALARGRKALDTVTGAAWTKALTHRADERTIRVSAPDEAPACKGFPGACGAAADEACAPGCPSLATDAG